MPVVRDPELQTEPLPKAARLTRARRIAILKALADPHRLQIVERIASAGCPVGCVETRAALAISPATLSHHIKELETAGLIHAERSGKFIYLTLRAEVWSALVASLAALTPVGCASHGEASAKIFHKTAESQPPGR
jgi:ArsR family transcriptional regulator